MSLSLLFQCGHHLHGREIGLNGTHKIQSRPDERRIKAFVGNQLVLQSHLSKLSHCDTTLRFYELCSFPLSGFWILVKMNNLNV